MTQPLFSAAQILLPDPKKTDMTKWACIACDQFTSDAAYWEEVKRITSGAPSTLDLFLPEAWLDGWEEKIARINTNMRSMTDEMLTAHDNAMIFLERVIPDGRSRYGIIGKIDLEQYDYRRGSTSPIRATEQTVIERIPPRVAIRRDAAIELPHVMMLYEDETKELETRLLAVVKDEEPLYDFSLMMGGGSVRGTLLPAEEAAYVSEWIERRRTSGMALAVGDGNHSLASAKALYEELKAQIGEEKARTHPARYALCELVNIHSDALDFAPIHRLLKGIDTDAFLSYLDAAAASAPECTVLGAIREGKPIEVRVPKKPGSISVGVLQEEIDAYLGSHAGEIDYIHGDDALAAFSAADNAVGIYCEPIDKGDLFAAVRAGGSLPRKTFSMGIAREKRYYIEARKIR